MIHCFFREQSGFFLRFTFALALICCVFSAQAQTVDCSDNANCGDPYCQFAANIEKGCNCFDAIDNDGDGAADKADSNCATYYGLTFVGDDADCSILPPGANDPFDMVDEPAVSSSQNTVDTQSKISVGDVDGDGIPDAVVTSKFNQILSVIATTDNQADGSDNGDQKAEFKLTGAGAKIFSGTGDCKPNKLYYELENMIADIDGDGVAEIFGIVGNRSGDGNNPPTCFWLVSFRYVNGELVPMYNAVELGSDRPGVIGIADMDGDGKAEVYMRDRIYAAETGALLATGNGDWDLDVTSGPVAVNVTGDAKMELISGTKIYSIPDLSNRNPGTPATLTVVADMNTIDPAVKAFVKLAIDPVEYGTDTHSMTSVADVDRDGNMDVVISGALNSVSGPTAVFYWNVAKGTVSHYVVTDPSYANGWPWGTGRVNLGDANGDGKTDLTFIAGAYLHSLTTDASGNLVPLWPAPRKINDSRSGVLTVSIYDFNNDGDPEVVYRDSQELAVIDGATGQNTIWSAVCQSHTYTEGPVIADVNGDGSTDICVPCNTSKSFDINDPVQQQALGQIRLYFSTGNEWLPTRKVWNQPGYFVVNINDDLTLPFPQMDQNLVFGEGDCLNGLPGPQMPMNVFLNQVPYLAANGCPVYPAPDLSFVGDNPDNPGVDEDGDGVYTPTVEVVPPICGDLGISVRFNIINDGDLPITADIPVSFFIGDPTDPSITSDSLIHSATLPINNLAVDSTYTSPFITFNGTGAAFRLYIVLNNDGTILPIDPNGSVANECRIDNNIYSAFIQPDPFETRIEKIADNFKCEDTAPDNGELRVRIFKSGVEVTDYSQFGFQWYTGTAASYTAIAGATNYNILGLAEGDYTAIVTNLEKGCTGTPVDTVVLRQGNDPEVIINVTSHQTVCDPPNGELQAVITGGNTGFTFEWYDIALNPLGISGPIANNLEAGNYLVRVSKDGCSKNSLPQTVDGPVVPDAQASTVQNIVDCLNPSTGSITATALFNSVEQDPANYTFEWYFYDNATDTRGSILPAGHGTGETRTGLPVGHYQVVVTDNATQCAAIQAPVTEITSQTLIPTAIITELAPQTSCDPANPNGSLSAAVELQGVMQDPADFTFEWFKGDNTLAANAHSTVSGTNGNIADAVSGGGVFYTVRVTTGNNCTDTEKFIITEDLNVPVVTLAPTNNGVCDPALATSNYNGTVTASVTFDGAAVSDFTNYAITWHDGSLETDPVIAGEASTLLDERDGGFYTAVIERTDLSCVSAPVTAEVVNALALPVIDLDSIPSTNCVAIYSGNTIGNGQAMVTLVDGVAPNANHSFVWSDNGSPTDVDGQTSALVQNVQGGFEYTVEITNKLTGCKNSEAITVTDASVVPVVSLAVAQPNSICDPTLTVPSVEFNGRIVASFTTPSGNAADYKYTWRNVTSAIDLGETPPINTGQGVTLINEFGGLNGNIDYSVIAENTVLGCTSGAAQVYLPNSVELPLIKTDSIASTNCVVNYGGSLVANGEAFVSTVDGAAPTADYTFLWSDNGSTTSASGRTTAAINQIQGGFIYTVEVTNLLTGCRNSDPVPLADASVVPVVSLAVAQPNSICDPTLTVPSVDFNGRIVASFITPSGNAADYKYTWRNVTGGIGLGDTPPINTGQGVTLINEFGGLNGSIDYSVIAENTVLGCTSGAAQVYLPNSVELPLIKTDSIASTNCVVNYGGSLVANGEAFVSTVDGAAPTADYTFLWSDNGSTTSAGGRTTAAITQIQGGFIYTVEVTNLLTGCRNSDPVPLADASVVPVVSLAVAQPNSICDPTLTVPSVDFNGRIVASFTTPSGNAADYKYTWRNVTGGIGLGDTPPINTGQGVTLINEFGGLNGNIDYSVIAENTVLGCTSGAAQVYLPNSVELPLIKTDSIASTNCVVNYAGSLVANGEAFVSTIDGAAPTADYTFLWSDNGSTTSAGGRTTAAITQIQGGFIYTVEVTNLLTGCRNSDPVPLADASVVPVVSLAVAQPNSICDPTLTVPSVDFNGRIVASFTTPSGNAADYKYTWRNVTGGIGLGDTPPINTGQGVTLINEFGGLNGNIDYSVIAENTVLGCTSGAAQVYLPNSVELPLIKTDSIASTNCVVNYGGSLVANGEAFVSTVDGAAPTADYTFLWSDNGSTTSAGGRTTAAITQIQGGFIYTVEVTNLLTGCRNSDPVPLADASVVPVVSLAVAQPNSICDPTLTVPSVDFNGRIVASFTTPSGNAADYKYTWRNVTGGIGLGDTPPINTGQGVTLINEFGGLNGNIDYSVIAENTVLGCTSGAAQVYLPNSVELPLIKTDSIASTNCVVIYGGSLVANGEAFVSTVDGAAPTADYTFLWSDNGSTTSASGRTTAVINQIQGGFIYTVEVTNLLTGCRNSDPVPLADASVVPVVSLAVDQPNSICDPAATTPAVPFNGRIETSFLTPSGIAADYEYTWHNVTDNIPLGITPPNSTGPGVTLVTEFGGLEGNKTYHVIAENTVLGCTSGATQVFLPNNFQLPLIETDSVPSKNCVVLYNGNPVSDGQVSVTAVDGGAPLANYTFLWSDDGATPTSTNASTTSVTNLEGGYQYSVLVTSNLTGCANTRTINLTRNAVRPVLAVTKTNDNINCDAVAFGSTGELEAVVTYRAVVQNTPGGAPVLPSNYVITWSTTDTGDILSGQPAGTYSATVVDETLGCSSDPDADIVLDTFDYPAITLVPTDQTSCDNTAPNGEMEATITTASGTLAYQWYEGIGTGGATIGANIPTQPTGTVTSITGQASDDYTIFVRNEVTGCESVKAAFIPNNITYPSISLTNTNVVTICGPTPNGEARATLAGLSALPTEDFDIFYVYTFTGGTAPSDPAFIKASADPNNIANGTGPFNPGVNPPDYVDMAPGYLTALVLDNNTKCESDPTTVQIVDATAENQITVNGTSAAGFCGDDGGGIDVTLAGGVGAQNYSWFEGTPSNDPSDGNINFFNNPPDMSLAPAVLDDFGNPITGVANGINEDLGPPSQPTLGVGSGTYTIVITDANGCGAYFVENVPFLSAPVITVTETDVTKCVAPFDGELEVDVVGLSPFGYTVEIFAGNGPTGTPLLPASGVLPSPVNFSKTALENGQYYVQVTDQDPLNSPCPLGSTHQLDQKTFGPQITFNQIIKNTSCDPNTSADGKVEITAIADSQHDIATNPTDFVVTAIAPGPIGLATPIDIPDDGTSSGLLNGFGPNSYTVTVTDNNSGCATDAVVNIPDQPVLPTIFTVQAFDDSYCAPTSNGRIEVTSVGVGAPEPVSNYEFEWYSLPDVSVAANLVYEDIGGGPTTGELFNVTKRNPTWPGVAAGKGWSLGATPGAGNGNRTYYVRGRRITGEGVGCFTQLEQKDVLDVHKTPNLTLTTFDNTSCLPGTGEGVIRAVTDIEVDPRDAGVQGGTYTYSWNPDPAGGNVTPVAGIARNANIDITSLTDNTYTVTSVNAVNGCSVSSTAVIVTNPLPITLLNYTKVNQLICDPDGNITVTEIEIDATNTAANTIYPFNTPADLVAGFDFEWFNATNDGDSDPATFDDGLPLEDGTATIINDYRLTEDLAAAQPFPAMGEGTYYVVATRKPGVTPGAGCTTVPIRVEIGRNVNNPVFTALDPFANTSCITSVVEGRIEVAVSTASGVGAEATSTYTYDWAAANPNVVLNPFGTGSEAGAGNSVTIPSGYVAPPTLPSEALKDDTYTVTATNDYSGCSVTSDVVITPQKFPITIISFTKQDQLICDPDGNITVTQVTIDGTRSGLPTFNFSTAATITSNFDFQWFNANNDGDNNTGTFDDATPLEDGAAAPIVDVTLSEDAAESAQPFPGMAAGSYYVVATRPNNMVPGAGCSTEPVLVNIEDKHINPVIDQLTAFANTSCDANIVEGRIELEVSTNSTEPLESASTYTYNWAANNPDPILNPFGVGTEAGAGNAVTIPSGYQTPPNTPSDALKDDTYTITVTNEYSNCQATGQVTITPQKYPITLISFTKQDQLICDPDGRITVSQVTIDGSTSNLPVYNYNTPAQLATNFDFQWFDADNDGDNNATTFDDAIVLQSGGADITDVVLSEDGAETTQPFATMGAGSYYVLATRKPGMSPGAGCSTLPIRVNIEDKHINPVIDQLTAFANTSCDANIVEGRIELEVSTNSTVALESGAAYTYNWAANNPDPILNPFGVGTEAGAGNAVTIPSGYQTPPNTPSDALKDDTYTITVTNEYSNCQATGQVTITPQKYPITLISFTKQDQLICDPDGRITVSQVTIDGSTSNLPVYNYNTPAQLATNFDFQWFDADNDGDNNATTFDDAIVLQSGGADITDVVLSEDGAETTQPFATMGAGSYYVLATRKPGMSPGAGCSTLPIRVNIEDKHINPVIDQLTAFANTSCDANIVEGRIELEVSTNSTVALESGAAYTYNWAANNPDPILNPFGVGTEAGAGNAVTIPSGYQTPPNTPSDALKDDTYTITVTNEYSNCQATGQVTITPQKYPITLISFTKQDQLICDPDGRITVSQVTIDGSTSNLPVYNYNTPAQLATNFDFQWFDANNDGDNNATTFDDAIVLQSGGADITDVVLSEDGAETTQPFATMGAGSYYVLATRKPGMSPGAGCSTLPIRVNIEDKHINPVIDQLTAFANTSCDANIVEGRIELEVSTNSTVALESGAAYTYNWAANNPDPILNPFGVGTEAGAGNAVTIPSGYQTPPNTPSDALKDDTYTINVTNEYSNCQATGQVTITPQKYPITLISFTKQNQLICDPDGRITVSQVTIDGSTSNLPVYNYNTPAQLAGNFDFQWFDADNDGDNNATTFDDAIVLQSGGVDITDVVLSEDGAETTQPFASMGAGSYYVLATRKTGMSPGAGCSTLPIRVNIEDKHINPVIDKLTAFANTSCDEDIVEGRIELEVSTNSTLALESGADYTYNWAAENPDPLLNPFGVGTEAGAGSAVTLPSGYVAPPTTPSNALKDDTYTITVTNEYSNCQATGQMTITPQKYPITLISFTKQDQLICDPDGRITVTQVTIDGTSGNLPVYNYSTPAQLTDNFDFQWFDAESDGDNNASTFDNTIPLEDGVNPVTDVVLSADPLEAAQPYPGMRAGTYFVVAKRKPGMSPGAGCLTKPVRVNIEDRHVDPNLAFTFAPNTSCNVNNPNGQIIATASERDNTTDNYTFIWKLNGAALPPETTTSGASPVSQLDNAFEGQYAVVVTNTITGCDMSSGIEVNLDHNISLPNIITVDTFDPLDCLNSGSAEVTAISIGGGPAITGPDLDTDFEFEWYANNFSAADQLTNMDPLLPGINAGRYFVRVQDLLTDCKSSPTEVVILEDDIVYPVVTIDQTALQVRCVVDQGTAELVARGDGNTDADPDYQFSWFNNLETSGPSFSSTSTISDLLHGEYSVLVTNDATGCSASEIYVVRDDSDRFLPKISLNTQARIDCLVPDGVLLVREVGYDPNNMEYPYPSANFTAEYYQGENVDLLQPGTTMTNLPGFNRNWREVNIDVDIYTVKIRDNNTGCFSAAVKSVADGRTNPVVVIDEDNPLINCDPARPNGQLSATADGGFVGGYQFDWYNGVTASGTIIGDNNKLIGIGMGDYTVRVTNDFTNCFADGTASMSDGRLLPPSPTAVLIRDRTRCDFPDGVVAANVNGITLNYSFDWYDGETVDGSPDFIGDRYKDRDIGVYSVTAMDETTGCISLPESVEVKDLRVIPEVVIHTMPSYCEELPGQIGGTGTAEVELVPANILTDQVEWTLQPDMATIGIGSYLTNILPGLYQANVTTSSGCEAVGTGEVKTEVYSYNLVSTNGDGKNDNFRIDCITQYPGNNVKIFNRSGVLVYEADGYDNNDVVFTGIGENGVYTIGNNLPVGTYFYIIDKRDGSQPKTGYLELVK